MKWTIAMAAAAVLAAWTGAAAQSMAQADRMNGMDVTYSGCVSVAKGGAVTLTHAVAGSNGHAMQDGSMAHDGMMKKDGQPMMKDEAMMKPASITLSSTSVDLRKHAGQKVLVTGSPADGMGAMEKDSMRAEPMGKSSMEAPAPAFSVKSLKVLAARCS